MQFADRHDAGRRLAEALKRFKDQHPVILALPRGGVPVAFDIAQELDAPLDVVLVRKIGHPLSQEMAIGAIAEGQPIEKVIDQGAVADFNIPAAYIDAEIETQTREIELRRQLYCKGRQPIDLHRRTVIVVDDGIATGATMHAAIQAIRHRKPGKLILAVPVAPPQALEDFRPDVDEIVCLATPARFGAVGQFYDDFRPVGDATVIDLLDRASDRKDAQS